MGAGNAAVKLVRSRALTAAATEPNLPDPTALAFSTLTGGQVRFYAATAGRESAELVALSLGFDTGTISQLAAAGSLNTASQLVPLEASSLPLVATVLTLTITLSEEETPLAAFLPGTGVSVGQGLTSQGRGGPGGEDGPVADESGSSVAGAVPAVIAPWERFVIGLDKAVEQFWRDNPNGVSGDSARGPASDRSDSPSGSDAPAQGGPTSSKSGYDLVPGGGEPDHTEDPSKTPDVEANDAIIQSVWGEDRSRASQEQRADAGWTSGRSHAVLPRIQFIDSRHPRSLPLNRIVAEPESRVRSQLSRIGSEHWFKQVRPLGPEAGKDEPDLALTSLIVATMATEWFHACRWQRTSRPRTPGRAVNSGRRRRVVIK